MHWQAGGSHQSLNSVCYARCLILSDLSFSFEISLWSCTTGVYLLSISFGCISTSFVVSFYFSFDTVASWLFSNNPDANFEKSPFRGYKVSSIKGITYCSPCVLNSICWDLSDFTDVGPLTGENLLEPSASASLYLQFARHPKEKACNDKKSLTLTK